MLSSGFKDQIYNVLKFMPESVQCAVFSATMPLEVFEVIKECMQDPIRKNPCREGSPHTRWYEAIFHRHRSGSGSWRRFVTCMARRLSLRQSSTATYARRLIGRQFRCKFRCRTETSPFRLCMSTWTKRSVRWAHIIVAIMLLHYTT